MSTAPAEGKGGLQGRVRALAVQAGFAHAGLAALPAPGEAAERKAFLEHWLEAGHAGEMEWLGRRNGEGELLRSSVGHVAPWARSVVVCAAPYGEGRPERSTGAAAPGSGWIARYAWSGTRGPGGEIRPADYHKVLLARLKKLEAALAEAWPGVRTWGWVDTGPVIEREWAARAGVGWTGKNACTLHEELGSFFFLAVVLTSLEVPTEARAALAEDRCGSCTRCLDACPTDALVAPRVMDASRCIAYLTIEKRGEIPEAFREGVGRNVFGCDICQEVCPWNAKAGRGPVRVDAEMQVREELVNPPLAALAELDEAEWQKLFFGSPVKRAKWAGWRRNLALAMGNSGEAAFAPKLREWAAEDDPVLRGTAEWALRKLGA